MGKNVCAVGSRFKGVCSACDGSMVEGTMKTGEFATIDGNPICVTGSEGVGDCGHTCHSVGLSEVWTINGKPVVRVGDPVEGTIVGTLISGTWVTSD